MIARAQKHGVVVTVDPNPNNPIEWCGVTAIKPNRSEAFRVAGVIDDGPHASAPAEDPTIMEVARLLRERWPCEHLMITLGEQGMLLVSDAQAPVHVPPKAREVFDVSGAGDTAIALFTLALCSDATGAEAADSPTTPAASLWRK